MITGLQFGTLDYISKVIAANPDFFNNGGYLEAEHGHAGDYFEFDGEYLTWSESWPVKRLNIKNGDFTVSSWTDSPSVKERVVELTQLPGTNVQKALAILGVNSKTTKAGLISSITSIFKKSVLERELKPPVD